MVIRFMAATSLAMLSRMIFSRLRSRKPSTHVDTEHGFRGNLKAIRAVFRLNLLCRRVHGRRQRGAGAKAADTAGQDAGDLPEPRAVRQFPTVADLTLHAPLQGHTCARR